MRRLLVVDDSRMHRMATRDILQTQGYEVEESPVGRSALRCLQTDSPDLVLLDLLLPDVDGLAVLREIRAQGLDLPVIVVTADRQETTHHLLLAEGATEVLHKPISPDELERVVEGVFAVA